MKAGFFCEELMYVKRDSAGTIVAISKFVDTGFTELLADDNVELLAFIQNAKSIGQRELEQTDQTMARVMEDVVNLLVEQGVIRFTDLPDAAQHKLLNRRELRGKRQGVDLLDDGDNLHL
jgi:hypothetical protein